MEFLDSVGGGAGGDEGDVAQREGLAAGFAEVADDRQALVPGDFGGLQDGRGVSGGGEDEEDVAGGAEGLDLAGENVLVPVVVGHAAHVGRVAEGDGGIGLPVGPESAGPLFAEVHGVGHAAPVSTGDDLMAGLEGFENGVSRFLDRVHHARIGSEGVKKLVGLAERFLDDGSHCLYVSRSVR